MRTPLKHALRALLPVYALFLLSQRSFAFCFAPQLKVSDEFYVSDLVLTGTVVSAKDIRDPRDSDFTSGTFYSIRVDNYLHGKARTLLRVYSENSTARFPMDLHQRYVLFLSKDLDHHWVVENCGNSAIMSKAATTMAALKQLPLRQSFVYGDVFLYYGAPDAPCEPMRLTIYSPNFSKTTVVQRNCTFHMDLPPGRYGATLKRDGVTVLSNDLNYKDIYCFDVPAGGSAGLAFREMSGADKMNIDATARTDRGYKSRCTSGKNLRGPIYIP